MDKSKVEPDVRPVVDGPGPLMGQLRDDAPEIMAELMERFIQAVDLNSRARVRMQMKALLDLFSVDTEYPAIPPVNEEQATMDALRRGQLPAIPGQFPAGPAVGHAIPVADSTMLEAVAEPVPRVVPAPGAPVAAPE